MGPILVFERDYAVVRRQQISIVAAKGLAARASFFTWLFAGLAIAAFPDLAKAAVIEIEAGGSQTIYNAPSVFTTEGVRTIALARRPSIAHFIPSIASTGLSQDNVDALLSVAADRYAIRQDLLKSVAWRESHFSPIAVSPKGAVGIMQLMEGTARDLGVNRYDLSENILGGAAYLRQMLDRYSGNEALALAAYNAGPGAVDRYGGIPRFIETQRYVSAILRKIDPIQGPSSFVIFIDR